MWSLIALFWIIAELFPIDWQGGSKPSGNDTIYIERFLVADQSRVYFDRVVCDTRSLANRNDRWRFITYPPMRRANDQADLAIQFHWHRKINGFVPGYLEVSDVAFNLPIPDILELLSAWLVLATLYTALARMGASELRFIIVLQKYCKRFALVAGALLVIWGAAWGYGLFWPSIITSCKPTFGVNTANIRSYYFAINRHAFLFQSVNLDARNATPGYIAGARRSTGTPITFPRVDQSAPLFRIIRGAPLRISRTIQTYALEYQTRVLLVIPFAFVFKYLSLAAAFGIFAWWATSFQIRRNPNTRLCQHCGYDLRASVDRCPECGRIIEKADAPADVVPLKSDPSN